MAESNLLRFRLDGVDYTLRGDKSTEQLWQIVDMVTGKIDEIRTVAPNYSAVRASTLAALQLAEELLEAREEANQIMREAGQVRAAAARRRRAHADESAESIATDSK